LNHLEGYKHDSAFGLERFGRVMKAWLDVEATSWCQAGFYGYQMTPKAFQG